MTTFADFPLPDAVLKAVAASGYTTPTPIQAQTLPIALAGQDVLLSAQTGSGKTAAFVLPMLSKLASQPVKIKKPRALILTPTRELAMQVNDSVKKYSKGLNWLFSTTLVGGMPYGKQIQSLKKGVSVVIATPGRLLDHLRAGYVDLSRLEYLVLDEADRMLDMGFSEDIQQILSLAPSTRQTLMSSATWDGKVGKIAASFTHNPVSVSIKIETQHIDETVYFCDDSAHKNAILQQLLCADNSEQTIIFTSTKKSAEELAQRLLDLGHRARFLHGDLPQHKRSRIVDALRKGKCDILVATDVAARGIDIPAISHVINYDLPRQNEDYVHRIGRSGRAGKTGVAYSLVSFADRPVLSSLSRYLKRELKSAEIEGLEPKKVAVKRKASKPKKAFRSQSRKHKTSHKANAGTHKPVRKHRASAKKPSSQKGKSKK